MSSIDLVILGIVLEKPQFPLDKNKRTLYLSESTPVEREGLSAKRYCQGR